MIVVSEVIVMSAQEHGFATKERYTESTETGGK